MCNETALLLFFVKRGFPVGREAWSKNHRNSRGWGGLKITPWNGNSKGVGGIKLKNPPWEGYGYFLELHNHHLRPFSTEPFNYHVTFLTL